MNKFMVTRLFAVAAVVAMLGATALAGNLYFQGFETDTSGWIPDTGGTSPGAIFREASGGGTLALTAFDGGYYAEVENSPSSYLNGYGTAGFSWFEGNGSMPPLYPGSGFSQSIAVYINVNTPAPTNPNDAGFAVDMSPGTTLTTDTCYPAACADEQLFRLFYTGSSVNVIVPEGNGASTPTVATITTSGWYTFQITYQPGMAGTVVNDMNILNASGQMISSTYLTEGTNAGMLLNADLAGPGYVWLPQWQNGFSGNLLGIDDVSADTLPTPEPPSGVLMLIGFACLAGLWYTRARTHGSLAS